MTTTKPCRGCIGIAGLDALGFITEKREKSMGSEHITRPGLTLAAALRAAITAGAIDHLPCPACWVRLRTPFVPAPPPTIEPGMFAWAMANRVTSITQLA